VIFEMVSPHPITVSQLFDKLMVCIDCQNALPFGRMWSLPTVAYVLAFTL